MDSYASDNYQLDLPYKPSSVSVYWKKITIPKGLPSLLETFVKESIRENPDDIYAFLANLAEALIARRAEEQGAESASAPSTAPNATVEKPKPVDEESPLLLNSAPCVVVPTSFQLESKDQDQSEPQKIEDQEARGGSAASNENEKSPASPQQSAETEGLAEEILAASKIQAGFRGFKARKLVREKLSELEKDATEPKPVGNETSSPPPQEAEVTLPDEGTSTKVSPSPTIPEEVEVEEENATAKDVGDVSAVPPSPPTEVNDEEIAAELKTPLETIREESFDHSSASHNAPRPPPPPPKEDEEDARDDKIVTDADRGEGDSPAVVVSESRQGSATSKYNVDVISTEDIQTALEAVVSTSDESGEDPSLRESGVTMGASRSSSRNNDTDNETVDNPPNVPSYSTGNAHEEGDLLVSSAENDKKADGDKEHIDGDGSKDEIPLGEDEDLLDGKLASSQNDDHQSETGAEHEGEEEEVVVVQVENAAKNEDVSKDETDTRVEDVEAIKLEGSVVSDGASSPADHDGRDSAREKEEEAGGPSAINLSSSADAPADTGDQTPISADGDVGDKNKKSDAADEGGKNDDDGGNGAAEIPPNTTNIIANVDPSAQQELGHPRVDEDDLQKTESIQLQQSIVSATTESSGEREDTDIATPTDFSAQEENKSEEFEKVEETQETAEEVGKEGVENMDPVTTPEGTAPVEEQKAPEAQSESSTEASSSEAPAVLQVEIKPSEQAPVEGGEQAVPAPPAETAASPEPAKAETPTSPTPESPAAEETAKSSETIEGAIEAPVTSPPTTEAASPAPSADATSPPPSEEAASPPPNVEATSPPPSADATSPPPSVEAASPPPSADATSPSPSVEAALPPPSAEATSPQIEEAKPSEPATEAPVPQEAAAPAPESEKTENASPAPEQVPSSAESPADAEVKSPEPPVPILRPEGDDSVSSSPAPASVATSPEPASTPDATPSEQPAPEKSADQATPSPAPSESAECIKSPEPTESQSPAPDTSATPTEAAKPVTEEKKAEEPPASSPPAPEAQSPPPAETPESAEAPKTDSPPVVSPPPPAEPSSTPAASEEKSESQTTTDATVVAPPAPESPADPTNEPKSDTNPPTPDPGANANNVNTTSPEPPSSTSTPAPPVDAAVPTAEKIKEDGEKAIGSVSAPTPSAKQKPQVKPRLNKQATQEETTTPTPPRTEEAPPQDSSIASPLQHTEPELSSQPQSSPVLRRNKPKSGATRSRAVTSKYRSGLVIENQVSMDAMEREIENEMMNSAATKIQAGFRGFKTRKSLVSHVGVSKKARKEESCEPPATINTCPQNKAECAFAPPSAADISKRLSPEKGEQLTCSSAPPSLNACRPPPLSCIRSHSFPGHDAEHLHPVVDFIDEGEEDLIFNPTPDVDLELDPDYINRAATRIQANFRGYRTRKSFKRAGGKENNRNCNSSTKSQKLSEAELTTEDRAKSLETHERLQERDVNFEQDWEPAEPEKAAAKIQASFRSYKERQKFHEKKKAAIKIQANIRGFLTRKRLANMRRRSFQRRRSSAKAFQKELEQLRKVNDAATKIQAVFRGYQVRSKMPRSTMINEDGQIIDE